MKRALSLSLAAVMITGVIASCSGKPKEAEKGGENPGYQSDYSGSMVLGEVPSPTKDPYEKYDVPITISTIHTSNDGAFWFPDGDSIEENIYTRRFEEELGIKYEFKWTCPGSQETEKMNTMFASGDLPDVMSVNRTNFEKLYAAGSLQDITVPLIEYASEYTRTYLTGDYAGLLDVATKDSKYYGITNGFSYKDGGDMIWIRKDWLDKLGLELPQTEEDLVKVMEAFKNNDPSGAGGTYAIALNAASQLPHEWTLNNAFFNMFGSYSGSNVWIENSKGEIEHGLFGEETRENTRQALMKAQEYYEAGYISPDFATMDFDMRNEDIFSGRAGVVFGDVWGAYWPLILHKDIDPEADWVPIPVVSANGSDAKIIRDATQVQNILVATKNCKNPEALVKMVNLFHDLNNNPETMEFEEYNTNPSDSNQIFLAFPLLIYNPSFNYEGFQQISEAQDSGNLDGLCSAYKMFYEQAMDYEQNGDAGGWSPYRSYLKENSSLSVIDNYVQNNRITFNEYTADPTSFMIENEPTVKKMYDEMAINVITGKKDIGEYDRFLESWDSIYGETAASEVNSWFQENGGVSIQSKMAG